MTTYMIHDSNGAAVSIGTVIADPLPQGLAAVALSTQDADRLLTQGWQWNPATLAVDIAPAPAPTDTAPEVRAAEAIQAELDTRLANPEVNSIAEVKTAIRDGLAAAVTTLGGA